MPPRRRSSRLPKTTSATPVVLCDNAGTSRPRKRARQSTEGASASQPKDGKAAVRRKLDLSALPSLPIDILFEIFGHVGPFDLLRLARTNKSFRQLLMNRSSRPIWRSVLSQVPGLPSCPDDLNEPQYARLAFDPSCHFCGAPNVRDVFWALRVRTCQPCLNGKRNGTIFVEEKDCDPVWRDLVLWSFGSGKYRWSGYCFMKDIEEAERRRKALINDLQDEELGPAVKVWKAEVKERNEKFRAHAIKCNRWYENLLSEQSDELESIRTKRRDEIARRLRELGFAKEIEWIDALGQWSVQRTFHYHKLVRQTKLLTDRMWSNMRDAMVKFMEGVREQRKQTEFSKALVNRAKILNELVRNYARKDVAKPMPNVADLYFRSSHFQDVLDTPLDDDDVDSVTAESFAGAMRHLPKLVKKWEKRNYRFLLTLLPPLDSSAGAMPNAEGGGKGLAEDLSRLELATSLFACTRCQTFNRKTQVLTAVNALAHQCSLLQWSVLGKGDPKETQYKAFSAVPWNHNGDRFAFHEVASKKAERIIYRLCDKDTTTTTFADMDDADDRFACACPNCKETDSVPGMTWRQAILHSGSSDFMDVWSSDGADEIRELEDNLDFEDVASNDIYYSQKAWTCAGCRNSGFTAQGLINHLRSTGPVEPHRYMADLDRFAPALEPQRIEDALESDSESESSVDSEGFSSTDRLVLCYAQMVAASGYLSSAMMAILLRRFQGGEDESEDDDEEHEEQDDEEQEE